MLDRRLIDDDPTALGALAAYVRRIPIISRDLTFEQSRALVELLRRVATAIEARWH